MRSLVAVVMAAVLAVLVAPLAERSPVSAQDAGLGAGGEYHPVAPRVVVDARPSSTTGPITGARPVSPSGSPFTFDVTGADVTGEGGVPDTDVLAVVLQVLVTSATVPGDLVAVAGDVTELPIATSMVFSVGREATGLVFVRPDAAGTVKVALRSTTTGTANVRISVIGWVSTSSAPTRGSRFTVLAPAPLYSTISAADPIDAGEVVRIPVAGIGGVPADAEAALLNVTLRNTRSTSRRSALSVTTDAPTTMPPVVAVAAPKGAIASGVAIVPIGPDGAVHLRNRSGTTDAVVDLLGFTKADPSTTGRNGRLVPLTVPFRSLNTSAKQFGAVPLGPGQAEEWDYAPFVGSLRYPATNQSLGPVRALFGTFQAFGHQRQYPADPPSTTEMRFYRASLSVPVVTALTIGEGQRLSNTVLGRLSATDRMKAYNSRGTTHYIVDVSAVMLEDPA